MPVDRPHPTPTRARKIFDVDIAQATTERPSVPGCPQGASLLERAVTLYRGPLLEGCAEEWAIPERTHRELAYLEALEAPDAGVR
jgi:hypothetical protein